MEMDVDNLFLSHPDPMWIYDLETLQFLAVNNSAVLKYGFTRDEFLAMTIADIRPKEDIAALKENIAAVTEGRDEAGVWRHRLKSGEIIHVDITGHTLEFNGRLAELISSRDVSRLVVAEQSAIEALVREKDARRSSDALARNFQAMFDTVPGMFIAYAVEGLDVIAISDVALDALGASRQAILGRRLIDIWPQHEDDPTYDRLRDSVARVLSTKKLDHLEVQAVLLPRPGAEDGHEKRYWIISNLPIFAPDGRLLHLMLRMQDVTEAIDPDAFDAQEHRNIALERAKFDVITHTNALKNDNIQLTELAVKLRTTQRLLGTGTWEYFLEEDRLNWSSNTYELYGVSAETFGHTFEDYVTLVHPEDRAEMRANFSSFMGSGNTQFSFAHRICRPDGRIVHIRGLAERTETPNGAVLGGAVQNVTDSIDAEQKLGHAKRMLEIAGTSAKFGAWRYDTAKAVFEWSPQTSRIHDEPEGFSPSLTQVMNYYVREHRERMEAHFRRCLEHGEPFADTLEIDTGKGLRKWVRVTGEAVRSDDGQIADLHGSFQDISELVSIRKRAEESELLLDMAGRAVKLGGWRVSLVDRQVSWTDGVAAIHELPAGTPPSFQGGISYFAPEEQDDASRVFEACATDGIAFDNVRDLITSKGNRVRVRSFGEPVRDESGKIVAVQGAMQDVSELTSAVQRADELTIRLAETLESIGDAFLTIDRDLRFTYLNSRAELLLERQKSTLIGRNIFDEFPESRGSEFEWNYRKALETRQTVRFEQFFPPLNRLFSINAHPTHEGLAIYFTDVTETRLRDEQLRLLGAAVDQINDVVIITESGNADPADKYKIVYVNDAFQRVTGFTRDEVIGKTPKILQGPRTNKLELERIHEALDLFEPVRTELINYSKAGKEYLQQIDIMPVQDNHGSYTHFVATQRDISDQRRIEETLRQSETRFRLVAKASGNAVWDWDIPSGRQWWSEEMTTVFGHATDPDGKIPTVWKENVHPEDLPAIDQERAKLLAGQIDAMHMSYRFRRADGSWANVESRSFVIRNDEGHPIRVLGSMADVSEKLQVEERLRQSQKLEAVGQLTGGVAHDFNNLLTIIMGNTELMQDTLDDQSDLKPFVDTIAKTTDRAVELTSRLLAFSRRQALQPQAVDVNNVLAGFEGMLRRTLGENIDIEFVCGQGLWQAEVDVGQLEAALLNLALNSRDAMPNGGALTFETSNASLDDIYIAGEPGLKAGQFVIVAVSDNGLGILPEQIDKVFEPFFTTKAVGKGTGLGLSMVYGFVNQSGGHVRIYSEPRAGTTVKMYFPRYRGKDIASVSVAQTEDMMGGRETILVVEDDALIREQLTLQLQNLGYTVIPASSGPHALTVLNERSDIDLLFTDVVLPGGMNGREVADAAQVLRPELKVLYTSGYSANAIIHHGRLDPGVEMLSKPYRRLELARKLRKVLVAD